MGEQEVVMQKLAFDHQPFPFLAEAAHLLPQLGM
jgi:hypothetical protein